MDGWIDIQTDIHVQRMPKNVHIYAICVVSSVILIWISAVYYCA